MAWIANSLYSDVVAIVWKERMNYAWECRQIQHYNGLKEYSLCVTDNFVLMNKVVQSSYQMVERSSSVDAVKLSERGKYFINMRIVIVHYFTTLISHLPWAKEYTGQKSSSIN